MSLSFLWSWKRTSPLRSHKSQVLFTVFCPWLLTFPPPHPCPGLLLLQANSLAKRLGHPPAKALCSFEKHVRMFCVLFPEWSSHLEWSESKEDRPGNRVLLDSRMGHVDISGWMCFVTIPCRRRSGSCQGIHETPELAKVEGRSIPHPSDKELDKLWFHLKCFLASHQAEENEKSLSLLPMCTQKEKQGFFCCCCCFLRKRKHWEHFWR